MVVNRAFRGTLYTETDLAAAGAWRSGDLVGSRKVYDFAGTESGEFQFPVVLAIVGSKVTPGDAEHNARTVGQLD